MRQMKDTDMGVLYREKTTALSEFFALELKFTIDTQVKWFNATFKQKFLELSDFQKHAFAQKNAIDFSKKNCCICGFMLSLSARGGHEQTHNLMTWYDFIVQQKYHFLKSIYDPEDIKQIDSLKTLEEFYAAFVNFFEVVTLLKDEKYVRLRDPEKTEKMERFFASHCADCSDSDEIMELIDDFKIAQ